MSSIRDKIKRSSTLSIKKEKNVEESDTIKSHRESISNWIRTFENKDENYDLLLIDPDQDLLYIFESMTSLPFEKSYIYNSNSSYRSSSKSLKKSSKAPNFSELEGLETMKYRNRKFAVCTITKDNNIMGSEVSIWLDMDYVKNVIAEMLLINAVDISDSIYFWKIKEQGSNKLLSVTVWGKIRQNVVPRDMSIDVNDIRWVTEFKKYVKTILQFGIKDDSYVDQFISEKNMELWVQSVTHVTKSISVNYEGREFYGDGVTKYLFRECMDQKFSFQDSGVVSEFSNTYMSASYQHRFSEDMRLDEWLIAEEIDLQKDAEEKKRGDRLIKIKTDLFESFFGTLARIGNNMTLFLGTMLLYNFMSLLTESLPFFQSIINGIPKTQITQLGSKMGFNKIENIIEETYREYDLSDKNERYIRMTPTTDFINFLLSKEEFKKYRSNPKELIEGLTVQKTVAYDEIYKEAFEKIAYEALLRKFKEYGITRDFTDKYKDEPLDDKRIPHELFAELEDIGISKGLDYSKSNLSIYIPKKMGVLMLVLKNSDNPNNEVLAVVKYADTGEKESRRLETVISVLQKAIDKANE